MSGYQTTDFSNACEVVKLYRIIPYQPNQHEATIFRKPNGEFEVHGACLVSNERNRDWIGYKRKLKIVTASYNVVEFERRGTGGISQMLFLFEFTIIARK